MFLNTREIETSSLNFLNTQNEALKKILICTKHQQILPTFNQLKLIERILHIMDPLKQLGEALASETKVTISGLWPVYEQLK